MYLTTGFLDGGGSRTAKLTSASKGSHNVFLTRKGFQHLKGGVQCKSAAETGGKGSVGKGSFQPQNPSIPGIPFVTGWQGGLTG